ncbi:hypothetical protein ACVIJU_001248 [Aeribacillus sp. SP014]
MEKYFKLKMMVVFAISVICVLVSVITVIRIIGKMLGN